MRRKRSLFLFRRVKKFLPRSLFGRSLLIILIPALLLQIITTVVFFDRHWVKMTSRLAGALAGEIALVADYAVTSSSPPESGNKNDLTLSDKKISADFADMSARAAEKMEVEVDVIVFSHISERKDKLFYHKIDGDVREDALFEADPAEESSYLGQALSEALEERIIYPFLVSIDHEEKWIKVLVDLGQQEGLLFKAPQGRIFSSSGYIFLLWTICTTMILFAIAVLFMRNQIRPIRRLALAAERFGKGGDVPAFRPEGAREVRQAAYAFLEMHDRVKKQVAQRTTLLASISHDLRTPLTRVRLQLAMMPVTPEMEDLKADVKEMERMIDGYLAFAKGEGSESLSRVDVYKTAQRLVMTLRRQNHLIHMRDGKEAFLRIRRTAFERALANILNNAVKYAPEVWVSVAKGSGTITIVVEDNGAGIPADKYDDVFKPFTRLDESRNLDTAGVGLGLPIAKDIVTSHGGTITLSPSEYGGLKVTVVMPADRLL